jgi:hypothetical protein
MLVFIHLNMKIVGVTGFEPATTRPPDVFFILFDCFSFSLFIL